MTSGHRVIGSSGHRIIGTSERTNFGRYFAAAAAAAIIAVAPLGAQMPDFLSAQSADEPIVKGAPYSGEATTIVKMKMFDGTQIERSMTAKIYRDNAGRVRREQTVMGLEALDPSNDVRAIVIIVDPVLDVIYTLIPGSKTANRMQIPHIPHVEWNKHGPFGPAPKQQSLGPRDIDGIPAIGRRTVTILPAGQVGNDRPIEIVDERWESGDLKLLIESRHHDPRTGDVEYRLTKISRKEPPADLFKVPAVYKIVDIPPKGPEGF